LSTGDCTATNAGTIGELRYCNEIFNQNEIVVTSGIKYSSINGTDLVFDLYTPPLSDTLTNRPLEIFFPGGGGVTEGGAAPCGQAARLGYVCMSGTYRNDSSVPGFSSAEQKRATSDMHALARYARIHASDYGIDPNKIMFAGVSAGGTVAMEAITTGNDLDNVNWFPATDPLINRTNATYSNGASVPSWACMAKSNSGAPMVSTNSLIDAEDSPTALFLGALDLTHGWTCSTGEVFTSALTGVGVPSYFQCFPESDHSLDEDDAIDAITIPMAYKEMIIDGCPQEYSQFEKIQ
jgi:acetyl esterase/lipase